jgi:hypothetical protein
MHAREDTTQVVDRVRNQVPVVREVNANWQSEPMPRDRAWTKPVVPGTAPPVVQGEPLTFDGLLAGIWADATGNHPQLRACAVPGPLNGELWGYARSFSALLGVCPTRMTAEDGIDDLVSMNDLIILGGDCQGLLRRVLSRPITEDERAPGPAAAPVAILAAKKPRWPLGRILLVLSGEASDHEAVGWALPGLSGCGPGHRAGGGPTDAQHVPRALPDGADLAFVVDDRHGPGQPDATGRRASG